MTEGSKLIDLSLEEARKIKWDAGQKQYGPVFVGHPLEQLNDEILDAVNYVEEARRWGYDMQSVESFLRIMHARIRNIYLNQKGERPKLAA